MAKRPAAAAAYENPLIPNARLRQIYLAMARARILEKALPAARRGRGIGFGPGAAGAGQPAGRVARSQVAGTLGHEACLVSTSIDLGPRDLVSDALAGGVVEFLRGTALTEVLRAARADGLRDSRKPATAIRRKTGEAIHLGAATRLSGTPGAAERIWSALGAAAALKADATRARAEARSAGGTPSQAAVLVVYALPGEVTAALWRKALTSSAQQELPAVFVVLKAAGTRDGMSRPAKLPGVSAIALGCGVPGIAVDADDAVALYRVTQESIGRARAGGGAALIECVPFVVQGAAPTRKPANDAIAGLERYMLERGIATRTWIEREAKSFAKRVATSKAASKQHRSPVST